MRAKLKIIGGAIIAFAGAGLGIASQVSATQAASNLASYFALAGLHTLPKSIAGVPLDVAGLFLGIVLMVSALGWLFWPATTVKSVPVGAAAGPVTLSPPAPQKRPTGSPGKYIVGGRAEDEPGVTIGPMSTAEALKYWEPPEPEYIPLNEAGQWLYDNGEPWLKDWLKKPEPFKSISEYAVALVGSACDSGAGALVASLEPGLKPEPVKWKDLNHDPFDAMFNADKKLPVNPLVRRSDLPSILAFYKNPILPDEPIKVRRDAPLREALMFAVTGSWGSNPWADGEGHLPAVSAAIERTRQLAADGSIVVWGKATNHGVWQRIEPAYWVNHYIDLFDVLRRETRTKAYNTLTNEPLFIDLMVSRAEFEAEWPEP